MVSPLLKALIGLCIVNVLWMLIRDYGVLGSYYDELVVFDIKRKWIEFGNMGRCVCHGFIYGMVIIFPHSAGQDPDCCTCRCCPRSYAWTLETPKQALPEPCAAAVIASTDSALSA